MTTLHELAKRIRQARKRPDVIYLSEEDLDAVKAALVDLTPQYRRSGWPYDICILGVPIRAAEVVL